jgi:hypothetical protein
MDVLTAIQNKGLEITAGHSGDNYLKALQRKHRNSRKSNPRIMSRWYGFRRPGVNIIALITVEG